MPGKTYAETSGLNFERSLAADASFCRPRSIFNTFFYKLFCF